MSSNDIDRIEKELIEQEHRPIKVITNYLNRKKLYPKSPEKQMSTKKAILWRLFFSPGVVAVVGGSLALASLIVLIFQNNILIDQNKLVEDQNKWFQQQIISTELNAIKEAMMNSNNNSSRTGQLFREYISMRRKLDTLAKNHNPITITDIDLSNNYFFDQNTLFNNVNFINVDFRGSKFSNIDFSNTQFYQCDFSSLPSFFNSDILENQIENFELTEFENCKLSNIQMTNCKAFGVRAVNSNFNFDNKMNLLLFSNSAFINCDFGSEDQINEPVIQLFFLQNLFADNPDEYKEKIDKESKRLNTMLTNYRNLISDYLKMKKYSFEKVSSILRENNLEKYRVYKYPESEDSYFKNHNPFINEIDLSLIRLSIEFHKNQDLEKLNQAFKYYPY